MMLSCAAALEAAASLDAASEEAASLDAASEEAASLDASAPAAFAAGQREIVAEGRAAQPAHDVHEVGHVVVHEDDVVHLSLIHI